ncbi:MAG: nucleotidyltransferase family protein [Cyanobacteria bacterium REEB67]|nr:nucleotidyltransferase family protein [Cyanobacteria bacterium REEB67]
MTHVIILAGGKGERMRPVTEDRPKSMVSVMGKPLLACLFQWLSAYGLRNITLAVGYRHEVIQDYFGDGSSHGVNLNYLVEDEPLGSGGALKNALRFLSPLKEPVLVVNGDAITNLNLSDLFAYHEAKKGKLTVVSVPMPSPYGVVDFNERGLVTGFREKPTLPHWANAGIYVVDPSIYELLPDRGDHEVVTLPLIAEAGQMHAFKTQCFWRAMDTVRDIAELRADMEKLFFTLFFSPLSANAGSPSSVFASNKQKELAAAGARGGGGRPDKD